MANSPTNQNLAFDNELSLSAPFSGGTDLIGTLENEPVILMIKNQSNVSVFVSDNDSIFKGTTMAPGEEIIIDCRANIGIASNMGFPIGTSFYGTYLSGPGGIGSIKISVLYAR